MCVAHASIVDAVTILQFLAAQETFVQLVLTMDAMHHFQSTGEIRL